MLAGEAGFQAEVAAFLDDSLPPAASGRDRFLRRPGRSDAACSAHRAWLPMWLSDVLIVHQGRLIVLELKQARPSCHQRRSACERTARRPGHHGISRAISSPSKTRCAVKVCREVADVSVGASSVTEFGPKATSAPRSLMGRLLTFSPRRKLPDELRRKVPWRIRCSAGHGGPTCISSVYGVVKRTRRTALCLRALRRILQVVEPIGTSVGDDPYLNSGMWRTHRNYLLAM